MSMFEIQDEDTLFFYTMQRLPDAQSRILDTQFGDWLVKKYGSLEKAKAAWDGAGQPGDDFAAGIVSMIDPKSMAWQMTQPQRDGTAQADARPGGVPGQAPVRLLRRHGGLLPQHPRLQDAHQPLQLEDRPTPCSWTTSSAGPTPRRQVAAWTATPASSTPARTTGYRIDPGHEFVNQPDGPQPPELPRRGQADRRPSVPRHRDLLGEPGPLPGGRPVHGVRLQLADRPGRLGSGSPPTPPPGRSTSAASSGTSSPATRAASPSTSGPSACRS